MKAAKKLQKDIGEVVDDHNKRLANTDTKMDGINDKITYSNKLLKKKLG